MKAVIMAGGEGTRLRPLTCDRPKPLLPVVNRPVLEHVIDVLERHGITRAILTVRYRWQEIQEALGDRVGGVRLEYSRERDPLGTAGSVRGAVADDDGPVLVISGDAITDFDLERLMAEHRRADAMVTIGLARAADPTEYGVVVTDRTGRVTRFVEKPAPGEVFSDLVNTGMYVVEPQALRLVPGGREYDFARDLFPRLLSGGARIHGYADPGYWCDIGDCEQYLQANIDAARGRVRTRPAAAAEISVAPGARLIDPCVVGPGVTVESGAIVGPDTVIGSDVVIGPSARVQSSVVGSGSLIGAGAELERTVTGTRTVIGSEARLQEGSVVADRTRIADQVVVRPRVRIWPDKHVIGRMVVRHNLVWGMTSGRPLIIDGGIEGVTGVELGPDVAAAVTRAAAYLLARGRPVLIGSSGSAAAAACRLAAVAGAVAGGSQPLDAGTVVRGAVSRLIESLGSVLGVYIHTRGADHRRLRIEFMQPDGRPLDRGQEHRLATALTDEPPPVRPVDFQPAQAMAGVQDMYLARLLAGVDADAIRRRRFRAIVSCEREPAERLLADMCERLGIDAVDGVVRLPRRQDDPLSERVRTADADFGLWVGSDGGDLRVSAGQGLLTRDQLIVTLARVLLADDRTGSMLQIPVDASGQCEELADRYGRQARRVSYPRRGTVEAALWTDGVAQLLTMVDHLARRELSLPDITPAPGSVVIRRSHTVCPPELRPAVMRTLLLRFPPDRVSSHHGVTVADRRGRVYVRPERRQAGLTIVCEATDVELADELTGEYQSLIEQIVQNGSGNPCH